ncbi:hypothetical protein L2E82_47982 [Cichorium intybus]|uniref:Uncharacterized protein n=1 Tax=Cichorium intybus TaxID=13427 RepID=A0ACB8YXI3_CICIN|nr:hypothetical protein L2E82_47982 [Cichorium intybus]
MKHDRTHQIDDYTITTSLIVHPIDRTDTRSRPFFCRLAILPPYNRLQAGLLEAAISDRLNPTIVEAANSCFMEYQCFRLHLHLKLGIISIMLAGMTYCTHSSETTLRSICRSIRAPTSYSTWRV